MSEARVYDQPATYRVCLHGCIDDSWSEWFEGFKVIPSDHDKTYLVGPATDQAALFSLLSRVRRLGVPLVSLERLEGD